MDDINEELVEVISRLATARRLREKQLREIRRLQENGKDVSKIQVGLEESKRVIRGLSLERRELAARLLKWHQLRTTNSSAEPPSPGFNFGGTGAEHDAT